MVAPLLFRDKFTYADGAIRWCGMTMSAAKVINDMRVTMRPGTPFVSVEQLIRDFKADIERLRGEHDE